MTLLHRSTLCVGAAASVLLLAAIVAIRWQHPRNAPMPDEERAARYQEIARAITKGDYLDQRYAHRGDAGPDRMPIPLWEWAARYRAEPYQTNEAFGAAHEYQRPQWAFTRFGVSFTLLPDGRVLAIGGEHEDSYDSDFFIYNDVIVFQDSAIASLGEHIRSFEPSASTVEIYGYSDEVFAPTDFHTATLVDGMVYIIGGISYQDRRDPARTPVYRLDPDTLHIEAVETAGGRPGWIWQHTARRTTDGASILIRGGEVLEGGREYKEPNERALHLNVNDYVLDIATGAWSLAADRSDWVFRRAGGDLLFIRSDPRAWLTDDVLRVEGFDVEIDRGLMPETIVVVDTRDVPQDFNWEDWTPPLCVEVVVDGHPLIWDRQRHRSFLYTSPTMPEDLFRKYWTEGVLPKLKEAERRAAGWDEE